MSCSRSCFRAYQPTLATSGERQADRAPAPESTAISGRWPAHAAREAVLADLERAIAASPAALDVRFYQASFLRDHGRLEEAAAVFEHILERAPAHVETLVAAGVLAVRRGRRGAARAAFERAAAQAPTHYGALVNLAGQLALDDPERARALLERAIALAPARPEAHRAACSLAAERGDAAAAERHRDAGYAAGAISARRYLGEAFPRVALALISTDGGNIPLDALVDDRRWLVYEVAVEAYRGEALPEHELIVNAVADADRCAGALVRAEAIVRRSGAPVVNHPAAVAATGRVANAARLGALPGVVTPATWFVRDGSPAAYPAIVRVPGLHMGRGMHLADDEAAYAAALAGHHARTDLIGSHYVDLRAPDGAWRKYRVMIVDGALYPLHLAVARQWKVHYFSSAMADEPRFREEEERFLAAPAKAIGERATAALRHVRDRLGLDYAGIDFALDGAGNAVVFEANAAMTVLEPDPDERFAYRRPAAARVRAAIAALLDRIAGVTA